MPSTLYLRALDPLTEQDLFRQAFDWRDKPRKNRMSFEDFAKDDPSQIVLGLFNGELQAVYFFRQVSSTVFDAHFTSRRKVQKRDVLAAAQTLVQWFEGNRLEIVTHILSRNIPLRRFVEEAGLQPKRVLHFDTEGDTISSTTQLWVEYRSQVNLEIGSQRPQTEITRHDGDKRNLRV